MGFTVFGKVVDKAYFLQLSVKLGAVAFSAFTYLVALQPSAPRPNSCGLTDTQEQAIAEMIVALNNTIGSCTVVFDSAAIGKAQGT